MDWAYQLIIALKAFCGALSTWALGLLNSNFFSALSGAFFGAAAADRIATRKSRREKLDDAVRNANSAIMFAAITSNQALNLKNQHVLDFHLNFALEDVRFQEEARNRQGQDARAQNEFRVRATLNELPKLSVPTEPLANLVFNSLKLNGRPIGLMVAIQNTLEDLNDTIQRQNEFCQEFKTIPEEDQAARYLGFKRGHVHDERYAHYVAHIYNKTNDLAFFASKICADLQDHGKKIAERWAAEYRKEPPHINEMKFDTPLARSLMPPEAQYSSFLSMFQQVARDKPQSKIERAWKKIQQWVG